MYKRQLLYFPDAATLVGTEPQQNTPNFSENDQCAHTPIPRTFLIKLPPAILTSFDSRLAKLEKSILPLYTSTQILTKREISLSS